MDGIWKVHLVMHEDDRAVVEEIGRQCQITCWNRSLAEEVNWASSGTGADPDILLINGSTCLTSKKIKDHKEFLRSLKIIRERRYRIRIVVLLPLEYLGDSGLITGLLKLKIYDLWFLENFDERDIYQFLNCPRTREGLASYIRELEAEFLAKDRSLFIKTGLPSEKIFQPYYIKSNVLAFYSAEDTQINTGLAVLTALNLAELGFKVALVETVTGLPHLAASMNIRHPFFNTSHALAMYTLGNNDFIKSCLYNRSKYLDDSYSLDKYEHIQYYPDNLYFLPDGKGKDNISGAEMQARWREFAMELSKTVMFEQDYHFLIYLCNGNSYFNEIVLNELAYLQFITINLLPSSIIYAVNREEKKRNNIHLIVSGYASYVAEELKELGSTMPLFCPVEMATDILRYLYFKDYGGISEQTQAFINTLLSRIGVQLPNNSNKEKLKERLQNLRENIWEVIKSVKSF